ncbi:unnamed protein product [Rotaria sp. Silwood2]|nr:unnamed protein product [Rotaria sp. Silwood2]CAF4400448.1 unnamed protein product [Rotaria sp. Silwood2]
MFFPGIQLFDVKFIMPLRGLRYLTLTHCTFTQLEMIFCEAEQLISLDILLRRDDDDPIQGNFEQIPRSPPFLTQLAIKIIGK